MLYFAVRFLRDFEVEAPCLPSAQPSVIQRAVADLIPPWGSFQISTPRKASGARRAFKKAERVEFKTNAGNVIFLTKAEG
jgi:hypothetical protein